MQEIKKIDSLSVARVIAVIGILIGLVQGILMVNTSIQYAREGMSISIGEAFGYIAENPSIGFLPLFIALGWWNIVLIPLFMAIGYFVSGMVLAWLYNLVVRTCKFGGIKIELSEQKKETKTKKK